MLGTVLSRATGRVADWFVMTDELLYERLGISIATTHSLLPQVRGKPIPNVNQLYPLLLSLVYRHGYVPRSLHDAHVLNAYVMTSAVVPTFLLARHVTGRRWLAYLVAALSVCIPWIVVSSFLLTEVAAYPAFAWCVLALYGATAAPRIRNDVLAILGLALATLARTQLVSLALVLPAAIVLHELAFARAGTSGRRRERLRAGLRTALARHRLLAWVYAIVGLAALALLAAGRLSQSLGTYSATARGNLFPGHIVPAFAAHLAEIALGLGLLPFVLGVAWLLAGLWRPAGRSAHAFAAVGTLTIGTLTLEVTLFDLRFGGGVVRDRYLFYIVPVVLIAFAAAIAGRRRPRWSLIAPLALLVYGLDQLALTAYAKLNVDTPASVLDNPLLRAAHSPGVARGLLIGAAILSVALFVEATFILPRRAVTAIVLALACVALTSETVYAFSRLFGASDTAGRSLTVSQGEVFDWVDRLAGTDARVTMVPFPVNPDDYWAGVTFWWDLEFWNRSIVRAAYLPGEFEWTPSTFPEVVLRFDPSTGRANASPTPLVAESDQETRFRISGPLASNPSDLDTRSTLLIAATRPWRADWLTFGLYDDGWTKPGLTARVRVFPRPDQSNAEVRILTLGVIAPAGVSSRRFRIVSDQSSVGGSANDGDRALEYVDVCVPPHGFTDVRISTSGHSQTYGDPASLPTSSVLRQVGVRLTEIALDDENDGSCVAHAPAGR